MKHNISDPMFSNVHCRSPCKRGNDPGLKMTSSGKLAATRQRGVLQTTRDRATQVESTTPPSTFSVRKAPPSQSLHSPAQTLPCVADPLE